MTDREYSRICELLTLLVDNAITESQVAELEEKLSGNIEAEDYCVDCLMNLDFLQRSGSISFDEPIVSESVDDSSCVLPTSLDMAYPVGLTDVSTGFDTDLWNALSENQRTAETVILPPKKTEQRDLVVVKKLNPVKPSRSISKLSIYTLIASAAAMLFIMALIWLTPKAPPIIAYVENSLHTNWVISGEEFSDVEFLRVGLATLSEGYAEIGYDNGVSVVIQAPAELELKTAGLLKLNSGQVYAKVPKGAEGFTVQTNSANVVDFGTEFGVLVDQLGRTEAHVFKREVELSSASDRSAQKKGTRLTAGQASAVEGKDVVNVAFQRNSFASYVPTAYEVAVMKKRPMSYWRLRPGAAQSLSNLANESTVNVRYEGVVDLVTGPFAGHSDVCSASRFYGDGSYMFIPQVGERRPVNEGLKDAKYTYMLWVRPDFIDNQIITSRTNRNGQFHRVVGITEDGHFNYVYWKKDESKTIFSLETDTVAQAGQWYLLAVTIDKMGDAQIFVNGRAEGGKVSIKKYSNFYPSRFVGQLYVGGLPEKVDIKGRESFNGAVADIVEYDRLLSEREIRSLYDAARRY